MRVHCRCLRREDQPERNLRRIQGLHMVSISAKSFVRSMIRGAFAKQHGDMIRTGHG